MEAVHRGGGLADATEHDDGAVGKAVAHRLEEAHTVELGHSHVRDDQRCLPDAIEDLESLPPATGLEAVETLGLQHACERSAHAWFIIDDETVGGADRECAGFQGVWHYGSYRWWGIGCHEHPIATHCKGITPDCPLSVSVRAGRRT